MNRNQGFLTEYRRNSAEYAIILDFLRNNGFIYSEESTIDSGGLHIAIFAHKKFLITSKSEKNVTRLFFLYKRQERLITKGAIYRV